MEKTVEQLRAEAARLLGEMLVGRATRDEYLRAQTKYNTALCAQPGFGRGPARFSTVVH